jgi:hypothetical protein
MTEGPEAFERSNEKAQSALIVVVPEYRWKIVEIGIERLPRACYELWVSHLYSMVYG